MSQGCYWGEVSHDTLWTAMVERLANPPTDGGPLVSGMAFRLNLYPALLLLYGGGIASVAVGKDTLVYALLSQPLIKETGLKPHIVERVYPSAVVGRDSWKRLT